MRKIEDEEENRVQEETFFETKDLINKFVQIASNKKEVDQMLAIFAKIYLENARLLHDTCIWNQKIDYYMISLSLRRNDDVALELC